MGPAPPVSSPLDPREAAKEARRKEAVQGFEEMFLTQLFKAMRSTVPDEDGSRWKKEWQERLDTEFARRIAESGGIGLSSLVKQGLGTDETRNG